MQTQCQGESRYDDVIFVIIPINGFSFQSNLQSFPLIKIQRIDTVQVVFVIPNSFTLYSLLICRLDEPTNCWNWAQQYVGLSRSHVCRKTRWALRVEILVYSRRCIFINHPISWKDICTVHIPFPFYCGQWWLWQEVMNISDFNKQCSLATLPDCSAGHHAQ